MGEMMKRRQLLSLGAGVAALGVMARPLMAQDASDEVAVEDKAVVINDLVLGDEAAPVEFIEYASFTCPHCANFHSEVYPRLKSDYVETGKVKFIYRDVYFNRVSLWASMIARCGGNDRFFGVSKLMYDRQSEWLESGDPQVIFGELMKLGKVAGLSDAELDACMKDAEMAKALVAFEKETVAKDNITSTPSFVINGVSYTNMSYDDLRVILDELIDA